MAKRAGNKSGSPGGGETVAYPECNANIPAAESQEKLLFFCHFASIARQELKKNYR